MYLSRMELRPEVGTPSDRDCAVQSAFWQRSPSAYDLHRMVWTWFPACDQRDFLYRVESEDIRRGLRILTLSARPPQPDRRLWVAQVKSFEPDLRRGDQLAFLLRANPTVCQTEGGRKFRHDVVTHTRRMLEAKGEMPPSREWLVQQEGVRWLLDRANRLGFAVDEEQVVVEGYTTTTFLRKGQQVRFAQADYRGLLRVQDPDRFLQTVRQGVGRARGFGCGMMLIRRAA